MRPANAGDVTSSTMWKVTNAANMRFLIRDIMFTPPS
jgi:hypothetical protein